MATGAEWSIERGVEEAGDALYPLDRSICIETDSRYPLVYVYSRVLSPRQAWLAVIREPPAYLERVVPADFVIEQRVDEPEDAVAVLRRVDLEGIIWVEARPRGYFARRELGVKGLSRIFLEAARLLGLGVSRRSASRWVIVEDTVEGLVVAVLGPREDRLSLWRQRRLRQAY